MFMKKIIYICFLFLLSFALFAEINTELLCGGGWNTKSGNTVAYMSLYEDGSYIYCISDNSKGVDLMLSGTYYVDIDEKGATNLTMNQTEVRDNGRLIKQDGFMKYMIVVLLENELQMMNYKTLSGTVYKR